MRDEPVDVRRVDAGALERRRRRSRRRRGRRAGTPPGRPCAGSGRRRRAVSARRRHAAPAGPDLEQPGRGAVAAEVPGEQCRAVVVVAAAEHDAGRGVAEEDARATVLGVHDARQRLGADDEDVVEPAGGEHRSAGDERVDEPRAAGAEVERAAAQPDALADERAGVGDRLLGRGGREHEQVDRVRGEPGPLDRGAARRRWPGSRSCRRRTRSGARWMPVRSTIHASVVSMRASRAALVSTPSGHRGAPARRRTPRSVIVRALQSAARSSGVDSGTTVTSGIVRFASAASIVP